jgi:hypothetical protein
VEATGASTPVQQFCTIIKKNYKFGINAVLRTFRSPRLHDDLGRAAHMQISSDQIEMAGWRREVRAAELSCCLSPFKPPRQFASEVMNEWRKLMRNLKGAA